MRWRDFDSIPPLPHDFLKTPRRLHFIGVGGIGMSALALLLSQRGHAVSGSDARPSPLLDRLHAAGVAVFIGHEAARVTGADAPPDAVIYSTAIAAANPERAAAQAAGIPEFHRGQLLANLVNAARISIAVSGTHGKSTTSAMIGHVLAECGCNPTVLLGAVYPPFGSNVRPGNPDLIVVEADESDGSFTLCHPTIAVVTNVEAEHLENYDDSTEELWRAFTQFAGQARVAVLNNDDLYLDDRILNEEETFAARGENTYRLRQRLGNAARETVVYGQSTMAARERPPLRVGVPGQHNLSNAHAALTAVLVARYQDGAGLPPVSEEAASASLTHFHGVARRFTRVGEADGVRVYDDYAHHPTEVATTLQAARDHLGGRLIVIFQPHRYSRTAQMGSDFGAAFEAADEVLVTQLYSAFEEPIEGVSGRIVYDAVRAAWPDKASSYHETVAEARDHALALARRGDVIFTMGAGDIGEEPPRLLQALQQRAAAAASDFNERR